MTTTIAKTLIEELKKKEIDFETGLTDEEIIQVEEKFKIVFPPDLKIFLQTSLPVSPKFVDWRSSLTSERVYDQIISRLEWPLEGMLFDIGNNVFWPESWGNKPEYLEDQFEIARQHFQKYPSLIPIYSHRYIPSEPNETGNPVYSVYQMDIVCYGNDLASYFSHEFKFPLPKEIEASKNAKNIPYWSDLIN